MNIKTPLVIAALFGISSCTPAVVYVQAPRDYDSRESRSTHQELRDSDEYGEYDELYDEDDRGVRADRRVEIDNRAGGGPSQIWEWQLEVGEELFLTYESTTDISMKIGGEMGAMMGQMMGGNLASEALSDRIEMETAIVMKVVGFARDGRYDLEFHVQEMVIKGEHGRITLDELPEEVRVLRAWMNRRGTVEFYERVLVEITEEGPTAVLSTSVSADGNSVSSSASADGVEITASISIDPRTGAVTTQAGIRETQTQREQRTRTVEEERPVQHLDVLPAEILSLLELPEGPVAQGDRFEAQFPGAVMKATAGAQQECEMSVCGTLRIQVEADSAQMTEGMGMSEEMASSFGGGGHDFDDHDMDDFGHDFEDEEAFHRDAHQGGGMDAMASAAMPSMKTTSDATMLFNIEAGRIYMIEGTSTSQSGAQGVEIEEKTTFRLFM